MQNRHGLLFLLIGLLLLLVPGACTPGQQCAKGQRVSSISLDPQGSACSSTCECNNQRYEGFCNQGICVSRKRESCSTPGERDTCTLLPTSEAGLCRTGYKLCQPDYLGQPLWGDCSVDKQPETDDACKDGIDNDCDGKTDSADSDCAATCTPGQQSICYTGTPATINEGRCKSGLKTCQSDGTWSACLGERTPQPKDCSNGQDNDCDGNIDKDCEAKPEPSPDGGSGESIPEESCNTGAQQACYTGTPGTGGIGLCKRGTQICVDGSWSACTQEVTPQRENCDGQDNDCDGTVDEGCVTTAAGSGTSTGFQDGDAKNARFKKPKGLAIDATGNLYIADTNNHRIRKLDTKGNVTTVAGEGSKGLLDGLAPKARFGKPRDLAFDKQGNLFISEAENHTIRKLDKAGNVTTIAGTGTAGFQNGPAKSASFNDPQGLLFDTAGNLYIADSGNHRIRKLDPSGNVITVAGDGKCKPNQITEEHVDCFKDGPALTAQFYSPRGLAMDKDGTLYVADSGNHRIRKLTQVNNGTCGQETNYTGLCVSTLAGSGSKGSSNGPPLQASFNTPKQITFDKDGNLYVADTSNHRIRKLTQVNNGPCESQNNYTGLCVSTFLGSSNGSGYLDGLPNNARFVTPYDLAFDSKGKLFISDEGNSCIRSYTLP